MAWTWYYSKELWRRIYEVEDLWNEQEKERLGEVTQNTNNCKYHSSEVTVCIAHENSRRVPVMPPERQGDANEWKEHIQREKMRVRRWMWVWHKQVEAIVENKKECNDE